MPPVRHSAQTIWNAAEATCRQKRLEDWDEISTLLEINDKKAIEKRSKLPEIDWELSGANLVRAADKQLADCIDSILAKSSTLSNTSYISPRRTIHIDLLKTLTEENVSGEDINSDQDIIVDEDVEKIFSEHKSSYQPVIYQKWLIKMRNRVQFS